MRTSILSLLFILSFLTGYAQNNPDTANDISFVMDTTVFDSCEVMPYIQTKKYKSFNDYVLHNMIFPEDAKKAQISGTVYAEFIIEKDGFVSNIKITKSLNPSCDQEVIRIISTCPKWHPGMQNGKIVRVKKASKFGFRRL